MKTQTFEFAPLFWWQNPWNVFFLLAVLLLVSIGFGLMVYWRLRRASRRVLSCGDIRLLIKKLSEKPLATHLEQKHAYTEAMRLLKLIVYSQIGFFCPDKIDVNAGDGGLTDETASCTAYSHLRN